jgi:hypothetical protein
LLGDIPKIFDMLQTEEFSGTRVGVASRHVMQQMSNDAPCRKNAMCTTQARKTSWKCSACGNKGWQHATYKITAMRACSEQRATPWQRGSLTALQAQRQRTTIPPRTRAVTPARANLHARSRTYTRTLTHMLSTRSLTHTEGTPTLGSAAGSITISTSWRRCDEPAWAREALKLFSAGGAGCCCCFLRCVCVRVRGHGHSNVPPDLTSIIYHSSARVCCTPQ